MLRHNSKDCSSVAEFYDEIWSIRDPRVENWLLMSSPWPTVALSLCYWFCSIYLGPRIMKKREAYDMKFLMQFYNIISVGLSAYVLYETCASGWFTDYNWLCQPVDTNPDPNSR